MYWLEDIDIYSLVIVNSILTILVGVLRLVTSYSLSMLALALSLSSIVITNSNISYTQTVMITKSWSSCQMYMQGPDHNCKYPCLCNLLSSSQFHSLLAYLRL